jgi:hypothetical protein
MDNNNLDITKILKKYPDKIPIILISKNKNVKLDKYKYLVNLQIPMGMFIFTLLKNNNLKNSHGIYLTTTELIMVNSQDTAEYLYYKYKSDNGALYLNINTENTFG